MKLPTERKFEKYCAENKINKGHISGRRKIWTRKKSKIEGVAFISKK